jgi:phenylalanyl-tRNA synthetase beta chain
MKVPYSWLKELLPDAPGVEATAELLAGLGLGVEGVATLPAAPAGVVVAEVVSCRAVEGSDHLQSATVYDGQRELQVVTGAPNVRPGLRTALARVGTVLPAGTMMVERRTLQGAASEGVLCSPRELGLYDYAGGLIAFGADAEVGLELRELWPEEAVIELELTPNRADAFSLLGVARDLSAKLGVPYRHPAENVPRDGQGEAGGLRVRVEDEAACPRFTLRLIRGVSVGPSPVWLQRRLAALGLRPRNNVVDVTNYVTFELGQPSHAYDRAALGEDTLVVRRASAGETLTALTEEALTFAGGELLIATPTAGGTKPVGVAGVIGGLDGSVRAQTREVALEVAHFDPVTVRRSAKRLGLSTDASTRFERGVDPNLPPLASARAAQLIADVSGGEVVPGLVDTGSDKPLGRVVFRPSQVERLMALQVPLDEQRRSLTALGCQVELQEGDAWTVTVPSWRFDLAIEEDLVEEVSRLHGLEAIPTSIPTMRFVPPEGDPGHYQLKQLLAGMGFQEAITYVFSHPAELARARAPEAVHELANPPSAERSVLRTALYPGLLAAAAHNRGYARLALFEVGRVFLGEERERLCLLARGVWHKGGWREDEPLDFYLFKGLLEKLATSVGARLELQPQAFAALHPGVSAEVYWQGEAVGFAGRLHPEVAAAYELGEVYLAELELPLAVPGMAFRDFPRQPFAERDLAVIAPESVSYAELAALVEEAAGEKLETLEPFDVYRGAPVPEGERSVALRLRFRDEARALRDEEVDAYMANVISAIKQRGYAIRES